MRARFYQLLAQAVRDDERVWGVVADIGAGELPRHERILNVGIREQLLIGVAAGLALEGKRPVAHSYAPFLVERPWEQIKLDLGHQDVGAILVSNGASYDASTEGRTHQAPEDVALLATLPGWRIEVPGHADELEAAFRDALRTDERVYIRTTVETNHAPVTGDGLVVLREGSPLVIAVGPTLAPVLEATADLAVGVAYLRTVRPFPTLPDVDAVVLVEPYLAGTSAAEVSKQIGHRPHRLLALGIEDTELRRYGTPAEHRAAHGLDARGLRARIEPFASMPSTRRLSATASRPVPAAS